MDMSRIRSSGTKPELALLWAMSRAGFRPEHQPSGIFGRPDFAFRSGKIAIFVDGDFWHGRGKLPKTNVEFWKAKMRRNRRRDKEVNKVLAAEGWSVIRMWESELRPIIRRIHDLNN